jgi:hypothetical protein
MWTQKHAHKNVFLSQLMKCNIRTDRDGLHLVRLTVKSTYLRQFYEKWQYLNIESQARNHVFRNKFEKSPI